MVLAALAIDVGRPVSVNTLIERVWDEEPPAQARSTLYGHVARIRRMLASLGKVNGRPLRLDRRAGGYVLDVDPDLVDLHRLRRLADRCQDRTVSDEVRVVRLREALLLWRGAPLAGLTGPWVQQVRDGCHQRRLETILAWADTELRLLNPSVVITTLSELLSDYPTVEPLVAMLMRALHATGRDAEALDAYQALRERLADRLGVDPSRDLRDLYQAILRGTVPSAAYQPRPATVPDLHVGRRVLIVVDNVAAVAVILATSAPDASLAAAGHASDTALRALMALPDRPPPERAVGPSTPTVLAATTCRADHVTAPAGRPTLRLRIKSTGRPPALSASPPTGWPVALAAASRFAGWPAAGPLGRAEPHRPTIDRLAAGAGPGLPAGPAAGSAPAAGLGEPVKGVSEPAASLDGPAVNLDGPAVNLEVPAASLAVGAAAGGVRSGTAGAVPGDPAGTLVDSTVGAVVGGAGSVGACPAGGASFGLGGGPGPGTKRLGSRTGGHRGAGPRRAAKPFPRWSHRPDLQQAGADPKPCAGNGGRDDDRGEPRHQGPVMSTVELTGVELPGGAPPGHRRRLTNDRWSGGTARLVAR